MQIGKFYKKTMCLACSELLNSLDVGAATNITNRQRRQNVINNFSAVVPYDMGLQRKEAKAFLGDLTARDQRIMLGIRTLTRESLAVFMPFKAQEIQDRAAFTLRRRRSPITRSFATGKTFGTSRPLSMKDV